MSPAGQPPTGDRRTSLSAFMNGPFGFAWRTLGNSFGQTQSNDTCWQVIDRVIETRP